MTTSTSVRKKRQPESTFPRTAFIFTCARCLLEVAPQEAVRYVVLSLSLFFEVVRIDE